MYANLLLLEAIILIHLLCTNYYIFSFSRANVHNIRRIVIFGNLNVYREIKCENSEKKIEQMSTS